jgi:hypothetical protein
MAIQPYDSTKPPGWYPNLDGAQTCVGSKALTARISITHRPNGSQRQHHPPSAGSRFTTGLWLLQ